MVTSLTSSLRVGFGNFHLTPKSLLLNSSSSYATAFNVAYSYDKQAWLSSIEIIHVLVAPQVNFAHVYCLILSIIHVIIIV